MIYLFNSGKEQGFPVFACDTNTQHGHWGAGAASHPCQNIFARNFIVHALRDILVLFYVLELYIDNNQEYPLCSLTV